MHYRISSIDEEYVNLQIKKFDSQKGNLTEVVHVFVIL